MQNHFAKLADGDAKNTATLTKSLRIVFAGCEWLPGGCCFRCPSRWIVQSLHCRGSAAEPPYWRYREKFFSERPPKAFLAEMHAPKVALGDQISSNLFWS